MHLLSCRYFQRAFLWAVPIGGLAGLVGLGGGEFRLPVLTQAIGFPARAAIPLNLLVSLVTLSFALVVRNHSVPVSSVIPHLPEMAGLAVGGILSAAYGARLVTRLGDRHLTLSMAALLAAIGVLLLVEAFVPFHGGGQVMDSVILRGASGALIGLVVGVVSSMLGVAGGELLIPTLVFVFGADIKVAGTASALISLPIVATGLWRYYRAGALLMRGGPPRIAAAMSLGSVAGAALGGFAVAFAPTTLLKVVLGLVLLISAAKIAYHARPPQASKGVRIPYPELMTLHKETPRDAFDLLSWRANVAVLVALVSVSAVAWGATIEQANSMRDMVMGLGQIGYRDQGSMRAVEFLAMWITMMAAMMLPTIVPVVLSHHAVALRRWEGALSTPAFVTGYMLVWSATGIVVWLVYRVFAQWGEDAAQPQWLLTLASAMLFFAGFYQFTRWKRRCADMCRSPLTFVFIHDSYRGVHHALRAGVVHGAYCLGCCWAEMMVLVIVGLTNLLGMAILFVLFLVEKNWKHGRAVANVAGIGMMMLGVAVLAYPPLLTAISN
ncbi:MAG TPA: TSUP family transporter [Burkholderiales bacterium]|nr:TSUP family transporter [Burkholderiales bacterium]